MMMRMSTLIQIMLETTRIDLVSSTADWMGREAGMEASRTASQTPLLTHPGVAQAEAANQIAIRVTD
jgi:hypothetical protein